MREVLILWKVPKSRNNCPLIYRKINLKFYLLLILNYNSRSKFWDKYQNLIPSTFALLKKHLLFEFTLFWNSCSNKSSTWLAILAPVILKFTALSSLHLTMHPWSNRSPFYSIHNPLVLLLDPKDSFCIEMLLHQSRKLLGIFNKIH